MVPRWISSRPNLSARAKKMQRAYAGRRIGSQTDSYPGRMQKIGQPDAARRQRCNSKPECVRPSAVTLVVVPPTPFAAEDEARAPGAPRPLSFCGLRSKSLLWLAAVTLAGAVLLVLYSNLRSSAEVDPRALGANSGFAMTRGSFEVAPRPV